MTQPRLSVSRLGSEGFQRETGVGRRCWDGEGPKVCFSLLRIRRVLRRREQALEKGQAVRCGAGHLFGAGQTGRENRQL